MKNKRRYAKARQTKGFTLIEVIVALTLTGFLLGGLFALVAGSKQLSWRAEQALHRSLQQRAAWNTALLENDYAELESLSREESFEIVERAELETPDRQTQPLQYALRAVELVSREGDIEAVALRWARLQPGDNAL